MSARLRTRAWLTVSLLALLSSTTPAVAQKSYPMLMSLTPVAAQTGQSSEHTLESRYSMFGAAQVLVSGTGVTGEVLTPMELDKDGKEPALTQLKLRFTVAPDALPGVREFRLTGPTGPSTIGQLVIGQDPVVREDPKNDTQETAQAISVPATVCGCVEKAEDVDYYRFTIEQPVTLTLHCQAMRLQDKIHDLQTHVDPIITIRNARTGATLAAADNTFAADPFLSHAFEPGEYLLEVRDVRYQGNKYWNYSIEISSRPFVSQVYPALLQRGQAAQLQLIGANLAEASVVEYQAPADVEPCTLDVTLPMPGGATNPVSLVLTDLTVIPEAAGENQTPAQAQSVNWPAAVSGRIDADADIDCYVIEAKKGDRLNLEVVARRHGSGLDSILRILNDKGQAVTENDDLRLWGKRTVQDSLIENWTVPADGRYTLEVRDVHLRGGPGFVYGLEITRAEPHFELFLDTDKTWLTPGTCATIFARAVRHNGFDGEIQLHVDGLPEGIVAHCGRILGGTAQDGCIVLEAAPTAGPVAVNVTVRGTAAIPAAAPAADAAAAESPAAAPPATELQVVAQPMQEIYMPGGGRSHWPVSMHTVAVGQPADILDVRLSTHDVVLKPGESTKIEVELVRAAGFDKNVTLDMLFQHLSSRFADTLPAGVTIDAKNSQTLLTGTNSKGSLTLTAAKTAAAVERQQCCVMANVSINFVMKATYSSRPVLITVAPAE